MPKNSLSCCWDGNDHTRHLNRSVFVLSLVSLLLAGALLIALIYLYKTTFIKNFPSDKKIPVKAYNLKMVPKTVKTSTSSGESMAKFTTLSLLPSSLSLKSGQSGIINLKMQTGTNLVSGVEITLNFDPKMIEIVSATPASFFAKPNILANKIDNRKGILYYAIGTFTPKSGSDNLVTFVINGRSKGQSKINFNPDTKVAAKNEGSNNVLKTVENTEITISP